MKTHLFGDVFSPRKSKHTPDPEILKDALHSKTPMVFCVGCGTDLKLWRGLLPSVFVGLKEHFSRGGVYFEISNCSICALVNREDWYGECEVEVKKIPALA